MPTRRWFLPAAFLCSLAACLTPIANLDLPWHLSAGRYIVEHRQVPTVDFLSWTKAGEPWIDFEWGTEVLDHKLAAAGGVAALWLFKVAVFAALMALFVAFLRLRRLPDLWIALALPPFVLSLVPFVDIRPELASYLFCLAQLYVLEARRAGALRLKPVALLLLHAALYALWANLHAGFPLGLALCLLYGAGEAAEGKPDGLWFGLAAAGLFGTLLNPYGPRIYAVFLSHWEQMASLRHYVLQWGPLNPMNLFQRMSALLFAFCAAALAFVFVSGRRPPYAHALTVAGFGLLAAFASRQAAYLSLTAFPLALSAFEPLPSPSWWTRLRPYALGALLVFLGATGFQVLRNGRLFSGIDATGRRSPVAACDFLKRNKDVLAPLRLYNSWNYGGYVGYALGPDFKVFMDGRYLFTEFLPLIQRALRGPAAWQEFLKERGVELVIVEKTGIAVNVPNGRTVIRRPIDVFFMPQSEWALVYWDSRAEVFVRRSAAPRDWLQRNEFRAIFPGDEQFMTLRLLGGALPPAAALAEVSRYVGEIHDPAESEKLARWAREFQK